MKTFVKLCGSIIRRNIGFSVGIFIMSVLSAAISFLGANFGAGSNDTIMGFLDGSSMPDAVYLTDIMSDKTRSRIEEIPGVSSVYPGFVYDTNIETLDGSFYSVRVFRRDPDAPFTHTVHEEIAYETGEPLAAVSVKFAKHNGIHPGDRFTLNTTSGKRQITVGAVVSSPETMNCVRDEMSAYESFQFAYLYLDDSGFNEIFPAKGLSNQWLINFNDDLTVSEQKECMEQIRAAFDGHVLTETFTAESNALDGIRGDLRRISVLCSFIPGIIWVISLGFNFIFMKIIVEKQRKTIGLFRALGFTVQKVVLVFISYTVLINLPALLCGVLIGNRLLRICLGFVAAAEGILTITVTIRPGITVIMLAAVFAAGIVSSLMSARAISAIDPCEAYMGTENTAFEPPEFISRLKLNLFFKISIVSAVRKYKRQITGALCIAACIISMCIGFEGMLTIGYPIDAVYGDRYRYDLMVRGISQSTVSEIENNVSGISVAEPVTLFTAEMLGEIVRVATVVESDKLTVLTDSSGNRLYPGEGVIIDEMCAKLNGISAGDSVTIDGYSLMVTGIAREILYTVMYISPQTAARMGYDEPNCVLLKLDADTSVSDVRQRITAISETAYQVEVTSQKEQIRSGFRTMRTLMLIFAIISFSIGSLLILNFTIIDFNENRIRYATLRVLGTPVRQLGIIAVGENLCRVMLGILFACPMCCVCADVMPRLLSNALQQYVMVKFLECLLLSCLIPLVYVIFGTGVSLCKIHKMDYCRYLNETE